MTRCTKNEVNRKSSAYNQTGQNYFEQLAAYNSMSLHLKRILSAKSVVDTRNQNYVSRKNKQCKLADQKRRAYSYSEVTDNMIDRLAYDTEHHPMDILRMELNPEYLDCYDCNLEHQQMRNCGRPCCGRNYQTDRQQRSTSRSRRTMSPTAASRPKKFALNSVRKEPKIARDSSRSAGPSVCFSRQRKCRRQMDPQFASCMTAVSDPSEFKPTYRSMQEPSVSHSCNSFDRDDKSDQQLDRSASQKLEEKKYVKFIYDITKEIMQGGLYTDKELRDVFKKHIHQNKGVLNMNRMLYEIYQLKISLNVPDDESEVDDELEDLIHAQKLLRINEIRPPTPPKVLDENKVMEKLMFFQKMDSRPSSNATVKTVVLIDANPELLVTERDVLISLTEAGIDPKKAQHIYKSLSQKSKDMVFMEKNGRPQADVSHSSSSQPVSLDEVRDDACSPVVEASESARNTVQYDSDDFTEVKQEAKQEACSSVSDLVSTQDETVGTEEQSVPGVSSDDHEVKVEVTNPSNSQLENIREGQPDNSERSTNTAGEKVHDSIDENSAVVATEETENLSAASNKTIQTEENTDSQRTFDNHDVEVTNEDETK